jgi:hypothetical protein
MSYVDAFDVQVAMEDRLQLYDVCDYRALAMALVKKCTLTIPSLYDGERNQPWNIIPEFGGPPPAVNNIKWHGRTDYDFLLPDIDDPVKLTGKGLHALSSRIAANTHAYHSFVICMDTFSVC